MSWKLGAVVVEGMLRSGFLERVPANTEEAEYLLERAATHVRSAETLCGDHREIAYDALYAAARKALTAVLVQQGLRPTRSGGHEAVIEAVEAQLAPPAGKSLRPYHAMKRRRAGGDYQASAGRIYSEDIEEDLPAAREILEKATQVVPVMTVFRPGAG